MIFVRAAGGSPSTHDLAGVKAGFSDKRVERNDTLSSVSLGSRAALASAKSAGEARQSDPTYAEHCKWKQGFWLLRETALLSDGRRRGNRASAGL